MLNTLQEIMERLSWFDFGTNPWALNLPFELQRFAYFYLEHPELIPVAYSEVPKRTLRYRKAKVKKAILKQKNDYVLAFQKALQRDAKRLRNDLNRYCDIYLGF